ncbi:MAG: tyrosine-type recombinase/integrase [Gordonia sp. (in: high G+C Gram-positive bacteria)]
MFKLAFASEAVQRNPMRDVSVTVERVKPRALTVEQTRDILAGLRADPKSVRSDLPDLVSFLAATGVRISEALAVRWSDLELVPADVEQAPTVRVRGTVVRVKGTGLVIQEHTKGRDNDEDLSLALPSWIVPILLARQVAAMPNAHDVVFPSSVGTLRDATNFRDQWRDARARLELEDWVTPKSLRKAVATAVASAKGAEAAAEQLGHASDEVTRRHYIERTRRADHRDVVERFGPASGE